MQNTIWKFPLVQGRTNHIEMPVGAEILTVQVQDIVPSIWALVDPNAEKEVRSFNTFGTGHPIEEDIARKYIGTYQLGGGELVFHVFERLHN
jgi:hypothetical protein